MMNRYDEILQIFESQKQEISKLSYKVNELEETNAFLITVLENSETLPPVYDRNSIRKDKEAAIEKEHTLKSLREKYANIDSTNCETTLNDSYDGNLTNNNPNSFRWSVDSLTHKRLSGPPSTSDTTLKPFQNVSISDDMSVKSAEKKCPDLNSNSSNINLRISHTSPVRRHSKQPLVFCSSDRINSSLLSKGYSSDNKTSNSEESENEKDFLDTVIAKSVNEILSENDSNALSRMNEKFHLFPKMNDSHQYSNQRPCDANKIFSKPTDEENLKKALDNLIETLQNNTKLMDTNDSPYSLHLSPESSVQPNVLSYSNYIDDLLTNKDTYISNISDKHTQMKILLTTQKLKADLLHQSLEQNNKIIFTKGLPIVQENASNHCQVSTIPRPPIEKTNEIIVPMLPNISAEIKQHRQKELSRLNNKTNIEMLDDPKVKNGFVKFTALVKGYIVRTLCETDKVRNIIITIKDTAQLAIKLRQERLSGDCPLSDDSYHIVGRRNHQEVISFQQRLVTQIKAALVELHEIFFEWSSSLQMRLIRRHINQLISSGANSLKHNAESDITGSSSIGYSRPRSPAKLSSATLKRRQKLALRRSEGNFKHEIFKSTNSKENGNKNSNSGTTARKPIYSSAVGCRGYVVGPHPRVANAQSKTTCDRKPRASIVSRRRGGTRTFTKFDINKISANSKQNLRPVANKPIKILETNSTKAIPDFVDKCQQFVDKHQRPQQQQQQSQHQSGDRSQSQKWIPPKTITTSVCSQPALFCIPIKANINIIPSENHLSRPSLDGDSVDDSFNTNKFSTSTFTSSKAPVQGFVNNNQDRSDWKTQTYTISSNTIACKTSPNDCVALRNNKHSDDSSSKSFESDFNENRVSRVEVEINDSDMGHLCQNNSHHNDYSEYSDPTESHNVVFVDVSQPSKDLHPFSKQSLSNASTHNSPFNKPITKNRNLPKHSIRPNANNVAISNVLKNPKPDFYLSINHNETVQPTPFKIRKRIVACSSLYSSTVSHS